MIVIQHIETKQIEIFPFLKDCCNIYDTFSYHYLRNIKLTDKPFVYKGYLIYRVYK